jgi:hypothetical protein
VDVWLLPHLLSHVFGYHLHISGVLHVDRERCAECGGNGYKA